jgi:D-alanyl-D-alanine carboxypeptidase (penicillin-binding protein 5/6)
MLRVRFFFACLLLLLGGASAAVPALAAVPFAAPAPALASRAHLLIDAQSGAVLAEKNPDLPLPPASLTKLLVAYVVFAEIKGGRLAPDQIFTPTPAALAAPGARSFLRAGQAVSVDTLLKGMIVQSGNDATLTLVEGVAGSEAQFVAEMNDTTRRLGMKNSLFTNATGIEDPRQRASARDLARLSQALIETFPAEYARYFRMRQFSVNGINQFNRNSLLWRDEAIDGLMTGHTREAGYCVALSSRKGERRLIAVLLGTVSERVRNLEGQKLLNYGFSNTETLRPYAPGQKVMSVPMFKGKTDVLRVGFPKGFYLTIPTGRAGELSFEAYTRQPMVAPVEVHRQVGTLRVRLAGKKLGDYPLYSLERVAVAGPYGRLRDSLILLWQQRFGETR